MDNDSFEVAILAQGVKTPPLTATEQQREEIRKGPLSFLNFCLILKSI